MLGLPVSDRCGPNSLTCAAVGGPGFECLCEAGQTCVASPGSVCTSTTLSDLDEGAMLSCAGTFTIRGQPLGELSIFTSSGRPLNSQHLLSEKNILGASAVVL